MENDDGSYLPGAAALIDQLDSTILVILKDGRNLVGTLRSFDQYLNLVVEETSERICLRGKYCDIPLGLFLIRGDNIVMMGEVDKDHMEKQNLEKVSQEEFSEWLAQGEAKKLDWDFE